jgi:hypothetical protein
VLLATCCCPDESGPCAVGTPGAAASGPVVRHVTELEESIPLSEVPESVLAAGRQAKPGIVFEEAVREVENGRVVYELEGEVDGEDWVVEVTADGRVLDVEPEEEDDAGRSDKGAASGKSGKSGKSDDAVKSGKS